MRKLAIFGAFLTFLAAETAVAYECPSYMVLTCAARQKPPETAEKRGWENRQVRIFNSEGDLAWKGRVETYAPTGRVRIYDREGDLVENFRLLLPDYAQ